MDLISNIPLIIFAIIIGSLLLPIFTTTMSFVSFLITLFIFYILFRFIMQQNILLFTNKQLPIVTNNDLNKYNSEYGVELRELNEQFSTMSMHGGNCGCGNMNILNN